MNYNEMRINIRRSGHGAIYGDFQVLHGFILDVLFGREIRSPKQDEQCSLCVTPCR